MTSKLKVSRNDQCPCGSGKKYKFCCIDKEIDFIRQGDSIIKKVEVPINDDMRKALESNNDYFKKVMGREMRSDEPIFFEEFIKPSYKSWRTTAKYMKEVGIPSEQIYAILKTDRLVSEMNIKYLTEMELEEWHEYIAEFNVLLEEKSEDEILALDDFFDMNKVTIEKFTFLMGLSLYKHNDRCRDSYIVENYQLKDYYLYSISKTIKHSMQ